MFCYNCGKQIPEDSKFCTFCGVEIHAAESKPDLSGKNRIPSEHSAYLPPQPESFPKNPLGKEQFPGDTDFGNTIKSEIPIHTTRKNNEPEPILVPPIQVKHIIKPVDNKTGKLIPFYANPAFWGSLLIMAGFCLPWIFDKYNSSGLELVMYEFDPYKLILVIFPLCAVIGILQSITKSLAGFVFGLFQILPILTILLLVVVYFTQDSTGRKKFGYPLDIFIVPAGSSEVMQYGFWIMVSGAILLLFFRRKARS